MKREILYTMKMPYRQDFLLEGFRFGEGEKSCAVVGGIRGDEVQQMYTCPANLCRTPALLIPATKARRWAACSGCRIL